LDRSAGQLLVVVQDHKYGYIEHAGRVVIRPQFIWANDFWHDLGTVYVCGHYVSIDASGAVVPLRVALPGQLEIQREGQKAGFVDEHERFKVSPSFDDALPFSGGLAAVKVGDKWGFIDTRGTQVIQPQFRAAFYFYEGVGIAESDSGEVLIDRSGRVLASGFRFVSGIPAQGRVPATKGDQDGYLDLHGQVVIPLVYDRVTTFTGGLAAVQKGDKWGYVDRSGQLVIPVELDDAGPFGSGLAPVRIGTKTGFVNRLGQFAFELSFDIAGGFLAKNDEGLPIADSDVSRFFTTDAKFGYVTTSGRVIWGPTDGWPSHAPLFEWSEEDKVLSCQGVSESTKAAIARLFPR